MVFGNLSTGYWLGAAAGGSSDFRHWVELGRTTLGSAGDSLDISGLTSGDEKTPDYQTDFSSSTGWTTAGTGLSIGSNKLTYTNLVVKTGTNQKISYDLGSGNVSDTKWVLRFKLTPSAFNADGAVMVALSDTQNPNFESNTDSIGTAINASGGTVWFVGSYANGSKLNYDNQINYNTGASLLSNGTSYYVEIRRTSATAIDFTIRTGSHTGTTYSTFSGATVSGVTGLRYIVIGNGNWGEGSATFSGDIDDVKFFNDETVANEIIDRPYMMILEHKIPTGSCRSKYRFNGDSGSNYAERRCDNGGSDGTSTGLNNFQAYHSGGTALAFAVHKISNQANYEKLMQGSIVENNDTGASNAPNRQEFAGKWANTSDQISSVEVFNDGSGSFNTGSEVVVLGYDPSGTSGTQVWEELASVDTSTAHDVIDTGTFTNKKYLWLQCYVKGDTNATGSLIFNDDTESSGYAVRRTNNGSGNDTYTATNPAGSEGAYDGWGATGAGKYYNMFIVNNGSHEALWINQLTIGDVAGAGNAPNRTEMVGKWDLTDDITRIRIKNQQSGSDYDESSIRVWGFD